MPDSATALTPTRPHVMYLFYRLKDLVHNPFFRQLLALLRHVRDLNLKGVSMAWCLGHPKGPPTSTRLKKSAVRVAKRPKVVDKIGCLGFVQALA